jgi:hypothetical protein
VVFSNDVFIEAESIVELLDTKGGDFDMVCGLDLAYWGYEFGSDFTSQADLQISDQTI